MNRIGHNVNRRPFLSSLSKWSRLNQCYNASSASSTIIQHKLDYYDAKANRWWDNSSKGPMKYLHHLDPYRIKFICDQLNRNSSIIFAENATKPLNGLKILDVGCGAGMISERLAMLGADVTGLDPGENLIKAATGHASLNPAIKPKLKYLVSTPEVHARSVKEKYDAVIVFFVLEQVQNRHDFLNSCLHLLKPDGSLIIGHVNRTTTNRFIFCFWNPFILRIYGINTIKYQRLMHTSDILQILHAGNCQLMDICGMRHTYNARGAVLTTSHRHANMIHVVKRCA